MSSLDDEFLSQFSVTFHPSEQAHLWGQMSVNQLPEEQGYCSVGSLASGPTVKNTSIELRRSPALDLIGAWSSVSKGLDIHRKNAL